MTFVLQDTLVAVSGEALATAVVLVAVLQAALLSGLEGTLVVIFEEVVAVLAMAVCQEVAFLRACAEARRFLVPAFVRVAEAVAVLAMFEVAALVYFLDDL